MRVVAVAFSLFLCISAETDTQNPVERVVSLIQALKAKILADGKAESAVYDKYACWCEKTTGRKQAAIEAAKVLIGELSTSITELNGRLGSVGADIANTQKQIKENQEGQNEAESLRKKENEDYLKTKAALEQGIANLGKAIQVLGDATTSQQRSHLTESAKPDLSSDDEALVETRLLTVAAGVRSALVLYSKHNQQDMELRKDDIDHVKTFLASPAAWVQTAAAPHKAEYTTQSTAIQGILKDMHDSFKRDLQDAIDEEATKKSDFESLMATKRTDMTLLENTLTKHQLDQGTDAKQLADDQANRKETQEQLDIDEKFLETTTDGCKAKAGEWAERSRLRTEEVAGINQAVDILTSDDAKAAFNTADTTFIQTRAVQNDPQKTEAYNILKKVASNNPRLATLASKMYTSTGWHFDSVIADIDKMIVKLREEEQDDIEHRDWCESERGNANSQNEALEYDMEQLQNKINRAESQSSDLDTEKTATLAEISALMTEMDDAKTLRNNENAAFKTAMKADTDSIMLIAQAIEALSKFFEKNSLLSKHFEVKKVKLFKQPEYTENADTAPETFSAPYGGRKSENTGIVAILGMIKEDLEKEVRVAKQEEAAADASYRKLLKESTDSNTTMTKKVNDLDNGMAELAKKISDLKAVKGDKSEANAATDKYLTDMKANCDWIADKFTTRQTQRKDEIKGLEQAKAALAGAKSSGFVAKTKVVAKGPSVDDELKELDATERSFGLSFLQRRLS